jgi:alkanesulfonate monooxygenase SsuD/methylene tetrahydromethanopterin reductase-like flavin-dependent oxidoreductase (luciferase family)
MFLLRFDLRIPPFVDSLTPTVQYGEMLEMVRWADGEGFAGVVLSEHHGSEDGFMNAPLAVAGATTGLVIAMGVVPGWFWALYVEAVVALMG